MAQWGDTDTANDAPVFLTKDAADTDANTKAFFVDITEAGVEANRAKGLKTTGWTKYATRATNGGTVTRHDVEVLIPIRRTAVQADDLGISGDTTTEDNTVADTDTVEDS